MDIFAFLINSGSGKLYKVTGDLLRLSIVAGTAVANESILTVLIAHAAQKRACLAWETAFDTRVDHR